MAEVLLIFEGEVAPPGRCRRCWEPYSIDAPDRDHRFPLLCKWCGHTVSASIIACYSSDGSWVRASFLVAKTDDEALEMAKATVREWAPDRLLEANLVESTTSARPLTAAWRARAKART